MKQNTKWRPCRRVIGVFAVLATVIAASPSLSRGVSLTWKTMNSGTTENLFAVWGTSHNDVYAVGSSGTILHYDGSNWSPMSTPTSASLEAVWGTASNNVYASGVDATMLRYDGSDWTAETLPSNDVHLTGGIWGSDADDIYAVGQYVSGEGVILHQDGSGWHNDLGKINGPDGSNTQFDNVWGRGEDEVVAFGHNGPGGLNSMVYELDSSGWTWWRDYPAGDYRRDIPETSYLGSMWGTSSDTFFAGQKAGPFAGKALHYDGSAWTSQVFASPIGLYGIWGTDESNVYAVGDGGGILHWNGIAWSSMTSGTTNTLMGIWGSDADEVFAVGVSGTILRLTPIPEPMTMLAVGLSVAGLSGYVRKRRRG